MPPVFDRDYAPRRRRKRGFIERLMADIDEEFEPRREPLTGREIAAGAWQLIKWLLIGAAAGAALTGLIVLAGKALARNDYPMPAGYTIEQQPPTTRSDQP